MKRIPCLALAGALALLALPGAAGARGRVNVNVRAFVPATPVVSQARVIQNTSFAFPHAHHFNGFHGYGHGFGYSYQTVNVPVQALPVVDAAAVQPQYPLQQTQALAVQQAQPVLAAQQVNPCLPAALAAQAAPYQQPAALALGYQPALAAQALPYRAPALSAAVQYGAGVNAFRVRTVQAVLPVAQNNVRVQVRGGRVANVRVAGVPGGVNVAVGARAARVGVAAPAAARVNVQVRRGLFGRVRSVNVKAR